MAYNPPPIFHAREELERLKRKGEARAAHKAFLITVGSVVGVALLVGLIRAGGLPGAVAGATANLRAAADAPLLAAVVVLVAGGCLMILHYALRLWINPTPKDVKYLPYPAMPDLTDVNDLYIGSGWSVGGKRPGQPVEEEDEPLFGEPHAIIPEKGLFGNIHITGAVGGGKTSTGIMPIIAQSIGKFHLPPPPNQNLLGRDGKFPKSKTFRRHDHKQPFVPMPPRRTHEETYSGLSMPEATAKFARMEARWREEKWGMFVIDPKGDMTAIIEQIAAYYGREYDVRVLRPGGKWTYNPLNVSDRSLVQAELVLEGVEAVSGQTIQQFWRTVQTEWLGYAIEILKAVDPKIKTFEFILAMARSESLRTEMVARAEGIMKHAQEEEARLRRLGQRYTGPRVDSQAIAFFREFDGEDSDPRKKGEVTQGIKAQAKYFTADEMIDFLCPKLPATFEGFPEMIDKGHIVVLQMPPSEFGPVGRVNGILMMSDAMQAARERILKPNVNQKRVLIYLFDEVQNYLNKALRDFLAMNRQSRACVVASHQSQSQLIQQSDRSAEFAFNDNLRNKIAYQAPNADAGTKLAQTIGKRSMFVQRWSESTSLEAVARAKKEKHDSGGTSVSISQTETPWFLPEEFIKLGMGEMIVRLWDGSNTANPRKIEAFPYYKSAVAAEAQNLPFSDGPDVPHPVVRPDVGKRSDADYLVTALENTGYVILLPLTDREGNLAGWWWTTAAGTLILSLDLLESLGEALIEKLLESPLLFVAPMSEPVKAYFGGHLNADLERVLEPEQIDLDPDAGPEVRNALAQLLALKGQLTQPGTWEATTGRGEAETRRLSERGRDIMRSFERLGAWMAGRADEDIEVWIAASTKPRELLSVNQDDDIPETADGAPQETEAPEATPPDSGTAIETDEITADDIEASLNIGLGADGVPDWIIEGVPDDRMTQYSDTDQEVEGHDEATERPDDPEQPDPETPGEAGGGRGGANRKPKPTSRAETSDSVVDPAEDGAEPGAPGTGRPREDDGRDNPRSAASFDY